MKIRNILIATVLSVTVASADDVMKKSMNLMNHGMTDIQTGFMNNNLDMIKNGVVMVEEGNKLSSDLKTISKYMPDNKKSVS